jgi:hypothetical protein
MKTEIKSNVCKCLKVVATLGAIVLSFVDTILYTFNNTNEQE